MKCQKKPLIVTLIIKINTTPHIYYNEFTNYELNKILYKKGIQAHTNINKMPSNLLSLHIYLFFLLPRPTVQHLLGMYRSHHLKIHFFLLLANKTAAFASHIQASDSPVVDQFAVRTATQITENKTHTSRKSSPEKLHSFYFKSYFKWLFDKLKSIYTYVL